MKRHKHFIRNLKSHNTSSLESCRRVFEKHVDSAREKDAARSRLYEELCPCFQNDEVHHLVWYRVAVHVRLLPDSIENFCSLGQLEQHILIARLHKECEREASPLWPYLQESGREGHTCKFTALFDEDPSFDCIRYNF